MGAKASRADGADSSACDAERLSIFISRRRGGAVHTVHLPPTLSRGVPGLTEDEWRRTIAATKRFAINLADNPTGIPVAALRHAAKGELRRAFPCGYCLLDSVNRGNCLGKLLGQKILIEPGMSATHEAIRAVVHKPSAGTRLGCVLGGGTNKHKTDPAPSDLLWMPTQSLPIGAAPRIVETGDLLWRVGLRDGDELLWVNNDEPRDANHAAALLAAADGKVSIIARRKKEYSTLSPAAAASQWWRGDEYLALSEQAASGDEGAASRDDRRQRRRACWSSRLFGGCCPCSAAFAAREEEEEHYELVPRRSSSSASREKGIRQAEVVQ